MIYPTISLGSIINVVVSLTAIAVATWKVVSKLGVMEMKLNMIWRWYKKEHKIDDGDE